MPWRVTWSRRAERQLSWLAERDRRVIVNAVTRLPHDIGTTDIKKLGGGDGEWRLRAGRWRVLMQLDNRTGLITITAVLSRDRAYRG